MQVTVRRVPPWRVLDAGELQLKLQLRLERCSALAGVEELSNTGAQDRMERAGDGVPDCPFHGGPVRHPEALQRADGHLVVSGAARPQASGQLMPRIASCTRFRL